MQHVYSVCYYTTLQTDFTEFLDHALICYNKSVYIAVATWADCTTYCLFSANSAYFCHNFAHSVAYKLN